MDGAGGDAKESRRHPFPTAPPSGEEHTQKQPTDDDGRKERVPGKYGTRSKGFRKMPVGIFRKREMGALVRRGRKNEWKLDRVMHALTQAMVFFLSRSLAHPVPCDYAQAWKVEKNDPSRLPFPFVQSRRFRPSDCWDMTDDWQGFSSSPLHFSIPPLLKHLVYPAEK